MGAASFKSPKRNMILSVRYRKASLWLGSLGVLGVELRAGGQLPGSQLLWAGPSRDEEESPI